MSLATASAWIQANPVLFTLIIWPAVTGLITAIARKRTAEEYAAMPPRLSAVLRFVGAVGLDLPKMLQTARLVITGGVPADAPADVRPTGKLPQDPPSGPGVGLMVLVLAFGLHMQGCSGGASDPSRDTARGIVLVTADAIKVADGICANVASVKKDAALAKTCADAYDVARPSLLAAESGIDVYPSDGGVLCSVGTALEALSHVADALKAAGQSLPPVVVDALEMAKGLVCHV